MAGKRVPRVDYSKMDVESGEDDIEKEFVEDVSGAFEENVLNNDDEINDSPTEEDVLVLEERLRNAQQSKAKLKRKETCRRLTKETKELEEDLKRMAMKEAKKKKGKVTTASLRKMEDVRRKVDRAMDERLNNLSASSSSEADEEQSVVVSSSGDESASVVSSSEEEEKYRKVKPKDKKKKKKERKGREEDEYHHKMSGKSKKLTSLVKFPQEWPHSYLGLHFVDKDKTYDELSMPEFCAGYASILEGIKGDRLRKFRLEHFRECMYLATRYQWRCVLNYHAACLLEVERGNLRWGQSYKFQMLQSTTLAGGFLPSSHGRGVGSSPSYPQRSIGNSQPTRHAEGYIFYCKAFQNGTCNQQNDHNGLLNGESRYLRHICARCWIRNKRRAAHPESAESCPSRTEQQAAAVAAAAAGEQ